MLSPERRVSSNPRPRPLRLEPAACVRLPQVFGELSVKASWLNQFGDVIVGHGISLLGWRSGGFMRPTTCRDSDSRRLQLPAIARGLNWRLGTNVILPDYPTSPGALIA